MIGETPSEPRPEAVPLPATHDPVPKDADTAVEGVRPVEHGGRDGPEPTRYGDWEKNGRCIDF